MLRAQLHSVSIVSTHLCPSTCPRRMPAARRAIASTRTFPANSAQDICLSCVYTCVCVCECVLRTYRSSTASPPWLSPASDRCLTSARVSPSTVVPLSTSLPLPLSLSPSLPLPLALSLTRPLAHSLTRARARARSLSLALSRARSLSPFLSNYLSLSVSVCVCACARVCVCVCTCVSLWLCACLLLCAR